MRPGLWQMLVILLLIALIFGYKKIPEIARALGRSSGEFKKGIREGNEVASATAEALRNDMEKEALRKELEEAEAAVKAAREKISATEGKA
jgi:sec-independent protein translocase protein TatA